MILLAELLFLVFVNVNFIHSQVNSKRLLDTQTSTWEQALIEINQLQAEVAQLKTEIGRNTYIRWGKTSCPEDNELVYKGYAGGSHYTKSGGAANWLCLTDEPMWGYYEENVDSAAKVYGGEYEFSDYHTDGGSAFFGQNLNDEDAPCAVCRPPRPSVVMIPGRNECYGGWTIEYSGYLVSGADSHISASEFICLDNRAEMIPGGQDNHDGKVFYFAEAACGSLTCPPYIQGRELTCVVCSK